MNTVRNNDELLALSTIKNSILYQNSNVSI